MKYNILFPIIILLLFSTVVIAAPIVPVDSYDFKNRMNISNVSTLTAGTIYEGGQTLNTKYNSTASINVLTQALSDEQTGRISNDSTKLNATDQRYNETAIINAVNRTALKNDTSARLINALINGILTLNSSNTQLMTTYDAGSEYTIAYTQLNELGNNEFAFGTDSDHDARFGSWAESINLRDGYSQTLTAGHWCVDTQWDAGNGPCADYPLIDLTRTGSNGVSVAWGDRQNNINDGFFQFYSTGTFTNSYILARINSFTIGDVDSYGNGGTLQFTPLYGLSVADNDLGRHLIINPNSRFYGIGDIDGNYNGNRINIDDENGVVDISGGQVTLSGSLYFNGVLYTGTPALNYSFLNSSECPVDWSAMTATQYNGTTYSTKCRALYTATMPYLFVNNITNFGDLNNTGGKIIIDYNNGVYSEYSTGATAQLMYVGTGNSGGATQGVSNVNIFGPSLNGVQIGSSTGGIAFSNVGTKKATIAVNNSIVITIDENATTTFNGSVNILNKLGINKTPSYSIDLGSGDVNIATGAFYRMNGIAALSSTDGINIRLGSTTALNVSIVSGSTTSTIFVAGQTVRINNSLNVGAAGTEFTVSSAGAVQANSMQLNGASSCFNVGGDTKICRDSAANIWALKNAGLNQMLRIYVNGTDTANYSRVSIFANNTGINFMSEAGGTGVAQNFKFSGADIQTADGNFYYNATAKKFFINTAGDYGSTATVMIYGDYDSYKNASTNIRNITKDDFAGVSISTSGGTGLVPLNTASGQLIGGVRFYDYVNTTLGYVEGSSITSNVINNATGESDLQFNTGFVQRAVLNSTWLDVNTTKIRFRALNNASQAVCLNATSTAGTVTLGAYNC